MDLNCKKDKIKIKTGGRLFKVKAILLSLITGFVVGAIFRLLKLPIPAPNALAGIMGIFGIFLGAIFVEQILKLLTK
jgi:XapX domain-containing protein